MQITQSAFFIFEYCKNALVFSIDEKTSKRKKFRIRVNKKEQCAILIQKSLQRTFFCVRTKVLI